MTSTGGYLMLNSKTIYSALLIISLISNAYLGIHLTKENSPEKSDKENAHVTETIKLYSDGQLVDQWEGVGTGSMEGNTYTFRVGEGAFGKEVRINGTFSVVRVDR